MTESSTRKRAPRASKKERTRAILLAARRIFERDGYEKAKMADIAAQVGVVEGTVFHYFGSKRALVLKVMEVFYLAITARVESGLRGIQGTRERLYFLVHYHLTTMRDNAELCGVILNASRDVDAELAKDIRLLNRKYTHGIVEVIRDGISAGDLRPDTSTPLVRNTLYGSVEHAMWVQLADQQTIEVKKSARQLTDMIYRGICLDQPTAGTTEQADIDNPEQAAISRTEIAELVTKLSNMIGH